MLEKAAILIVVALVLAAGAGTDDTAVPAPDPSGSVVPESAQPAPVFRQGIDSPAVSQALETTQLAPEGYVYWKTIKARVTAYEPSRRCCGRFADGKTATGRSAWRMDGCAADPRAVPYGTLVGIPGVGLRRVDDTGLAMKRSWSKGRYHVDVRMRYYYQARRWGRRDLEVHLYRKRA